jgi:NADH-quinone oxidoreductase subunit A
MIFIIFDIEIVFLYPWAVVFHQLHSFGLVEVLVFAAVVFVSFLYLVSNGALTWGPAKHLERAMPSRTSESTIARITAGPGGPGGVRSVATDPVPVPTGDPATSPGPVRAA